MSELVLAEAPDYAEPLEGWRVWRVVERNGRFRLGSVIKPTVWPAGRPLAAECLHSRGWWPWRRQSHDAPEEKCACGIYATTLARIGDYARDLLPHDAVARVVGRVSLWGTVVECERGYRASRGYPLELWVPQDDGRGGLRQDELVELLADYGVPVAALDGRAQDASVLLHAAGGVA
jgi:hypothetical protein